MSRKPVIGVTLSARGSWRIWPFHWLAIFRAGGKAVRITAEKPVDFNRLDGLVVGGGDDISADLYGGTIEPAVRIDRERDELEKELLAEAYRKYLPVLGICRGSQMINVTRGGSLHNDIYTAYRHARRVRTVLPRKTITIADDSRLGSIMGCNPCRVNALHHQSVDRMGEGLKVVARDEYDIVQGLEFAGDIFLVGVQWHPELLPFSRSNQRLFRAFVDACSARRRNAVGASPILSLEAG